jgi:hypothetical protein
VSPPIRVPGFRPGYRDGWPTFPPSPTIEWVRPTFSRFAFCERVGFTMSGMVQGLKRIHGGGDWHFITCSCYRRLPFLASARRRDLFLKILEETRVKYITRKIKILFLGRPVETPIRIVECTLMRCG